MYEDWLIEQGTPAAILIELKYGYGVISCKTGLYVGNAARIK